MSWTAAYIPKTGGYKIHHTYKENITKSIILVIMNPDEVEHSPKYTFLSRPFNSTNIMFEIRNITLDDAGYYNGGISADAAWFGGGVVLIVSGK